MKKAEEAKAEVESKVPNANLTLFNLDLGNLDSFEAFVEIIEQQYSRLDILINNAGIMAVPYRETVNGFESQFGVGR